MQQHLRYSVMDLDALEPFPGNARAHDDATLSNSVTAHGQFRTVLVRQIGGNGDGEGAEKYVIVAGHGTAAALRSKGHTHARVEIMTCSDEEALQINLMDNRASDLATYDDEALTLQLQEAALFGFEGTGWDEAAVAKLLADNDGDNDEGEPGTDPPPESWAIIVNCANEAEQRRLLKTFQEEGLDAKALIT